DALARRPAGSQVLEHVKKVKPILAGVIEKAQKPDADLRRRVAVELKTAAQRDWDGAAQLYLALAALSPDADRAKLTEYFAALRQPREFSKDRAEFLKKLDGMLDLAGAK